MTEHSASSPFPFPEEFAARMKRFLGAAEYEEFAASYARPYSHALRVNTEKLSPDELERMEEQLCGLASGADGTSKSVLTPVPWCPAGRYYPDAMRPGKHPYHEAGLYYIQEPSAMAPAALSGAAPGERILDLCAAPGGKTTQLAAMMKGQGLLVSNEIHPQRARILSQNVERMGIRHAVVTNMEPAALAEHFPAFFDRVLVDAPCSGEGMFRKEEAALTGWSMENIRLCAERQAAILDAAANMLCEGGTLVYSTCTFAPEENEGSIGAFLMRHPEFRVCPIDLTESWAADFAPAHPEWNEQASRFPAIRGAVRLWPHRLRGEGHFACVLRKEGSRGAKICSDRVIPADRSAMKLLEDFAAASLTEEAAEKLRAQRDLVVRFGEELYLLPDRLSLKGLKVLRPGLDLGTIRKDRFEPAHALALALRKSDFRSVYCLAMAAESDAASAVKYLKGETIIPEEDHFKQGKSGRGWTALTVDGFPLGWCKAVGGTLKNHYPRGLRWMNG